MADLILGSTTVMSESSGVISGIPAAGVTGTLTTGVTFPAGHIVKIHQDIDSAAQSRTVATHAWIDSNLSITFTPVSENSRFIIQGQWAERGSSNGSAMRIVRVGATEPSSGSTLIADTSGSNRKRATVKYSYEGQDAQQTIPICYCCYDDPNTASEITYKLQSATEGTSSYVNRNESFSDSAGSYSYQAVEISTMIIFEISS